MSAAALPDARLSRLSLAGARGPLLAAAVAGLAGLPGVLAVPALDRDEARFAQATAQMLETLDPVNIRFQASPRDKKPVGIHWLQAASVAATSSAEARDIAAYRWPSLLGAMLAAAACAWGACAFLSPELAALAGALLGATALLSTEAFIAKTDAVLCGATTLAMAALARRYAAARGGPEAPRGARAALWLALALSVLVKGPVGPMVAGLALLTLWTADRDAAWMRRLGWGWGLGLVALLCGPWAMAITVATDGGFWTGAVGGDLAPKLAGGHEGHGAPPGVHALLAPFLSFPLTALLPAAAVGAWRGRGEPGVRFALAWLLPSWLVFELLPTKLPHYPLPLYGALAWLAAFALRTPPGPRARVTGAALAGLAGALFVAAPLVGAARYGDGVDAGALLAAALALSAAGAGAAGLLAGKAREGVVAAIGLGVLAHMALAGLVLPRLGALWTSARAARAVAAAGLDPRNGLTPGPVAVAGYAEPSLVFALGTATELDGDPAQAAQAIAEGRPALVEARAEPGFRAALLEASRATPELRARTAARLRGYDYSDGHAVLLTLWRAEAPRTPPAPPPPSPQPGVPAPP